MKLLYLNQTSARLPKTWLEKWVKALGRRLAIKGLSSKELVVVFVSTSEMKRLNRRYRGKTYATDVLSFAAADDASLGELVLCWPTIQEQAKRTGLTERGELGFMVVHGVLHLLGYDHETSAADEAEMFALQDRLYSVLSKSVGFR